MKADEAKQLAEGFSKVLLTMIDKEPEQIKQPETPKAETVKVYPYITFGGAKPTEPVSFFSTWKFKLSGSLFAFLVGVLAYLFVFAR